jgi:hypothetical protein
VSLTLNKNIEILSKVQAGPSNKEWANQVSTSTLGHP